MAAISEPRPRHRRPDRRPGRRAAAPSAGCRRDSAGRAACAGSRPVTTLVTTSVPGWSCARRRLSRISVQVPSVMPVRTLTDFSFLSTYSHSAAAALGRRQRSEQRIDRSSRRRREPTAPPRLSRCAGALLRGSMPRRRRMRRDRPGRQPPCAAALGRPAAAIALPPSGRAPRASCSSSALPSACGAPRALPASCCCCRVRRHAFSPAGRSPVAIAAAGPRCCVLALGTALSLRRCRRRLSRCAGGGAAAPRPAVCAGAAGAPAAAPP